MDIEKLIDRLSTESLYADKASLEIMELCMDAATDLSTLQAENEKLRAEVNRLEYERDYPCIYFKAGGLCRYGGDESEANICVMGPCEVETTAEDVDRLRAEREQVKAELDAAIKDLRGKCSACANYTPYHNDGPCATCKFEIACFVPEKATDKWQWRGPKEN